MPGIGWRFCRLSLSALFRRLPCCHLWPITTWAARQTHRFFPHPSSVPHPLRLPDPQRNSHASHLAFRGLVHGLLFPEDLTAICEDACERWCFLFLCHLVVCQPVYGDCWN